MSVDAETNANVVAATSWVPVADGATIGHYEVIRPLGHGGMGDVCLARDTRLGRRVALKFLRVGDAEHRARFLVEAQATAHLTHENIVALYDIGEHDGTPYMALEYVPGKTLAVWLREREDGAGGRARATVPPSRAAELMLPVARALRCAHEAGIVHRDLKPANIMLATSGTVKVLDFGIAKIMNHRVVDATLVESTSRLHRARSSREDAGTEAAVEHLTQDSGPIGTEGYMAPEQWLSEAIDGRADLWALGLILYEMVTGVHPLVAYGLEAVMTSERLPSVREHLPAIGRLGPVIDQCLVKDASSRLGSAGELCEELEAIARPQARRSVGEEEDANPYAGLAAFQERDSARFFGRETAIEQIVARLEEQPLLALVGSSGAGKSSLVRAGVIPALKRGGDIWETFVIRPGPHPLAALAALLLQPSFRTTTSHSPTASTTDSLGEHERVALRLRDEPGFLGVQMRKRARQRLERALLFVDQFEEIYTLAPEDEREAFLACLAGAADDVSSPLRVLVSLRQDFLDRVASSPSALAELVGRGTVLVGPLDRRSLLTALTAPAQALEYRFESEALVTEMLDSLSGAASALPILQFTAAKLWDGRDRERRVLSEASYRAFGGVGGALASHADAVLAALNTSERRCARTLMLHLVTPEKTRALIARRELAEVGGATAAELDRVVDRLIEARLLTVEGAGREESTLELLHESLIATWPTLSHWLDEEQGDAKFRARLRGAAKEWEASHFPEGLLWRGEAEDEARRWQQRHGQETVSALSARETRYLTAVLALGDGERRKKKLFLAALIAGLSLVVVVVAGLALRADAQRAEADAQRAEAERSAVTARNATRMAAARERQDDPTTVIALLRELESGPEEPRGWAELARWALGAGVARLVVRHDDGVLSAAFSPDGTRIVSASSDKTARVWNADGSGQPVVLRGHDNFVYSAAFSPDSQRVVTASADKTVRVWNADGTGEPLVLEGREESARAAVFSPDGKRIVTALADKTVRIWNADGTGEPLVLRGHTDAVHSASFSPDGKHIVSASWDKTARVWNSDGIGEPFVFKEHDNFVHAAAFSPDGLHIASASGDKTVRVWNADGTGKTLVLKGHDNEVYTAAFSPDNKRIVSASMDKTVRVWNADGTGQPLVLHGHDNEVYAAAFSPDGKRVVSGSWDTTVRVWSSDAQGLPRVFRGHDDLVTDALFSPDGTRIVSASWDKSVRIWNADGAGQPLVLNGHENNVNSALFSPDGRHIVSASRDKTVRVWNADGTGAPLVLKGHENAVNRAVFSPDGLHIASASSDRTVRVWNADGTGQSLVLKGHDGYVVSVEFSHDGKRVISAAFDKTVRVWNADGSGEPLVFRADNRLPDSAAFSPDDKRIVSSADDKIVRVWNADGTGEPLLLKHDNTVFSAQFSPDGTRIVSAASDKTVRVWNADGTGEPLVLRASNAAIQRASFSHDGRSIIAASEDKTIIVWSDLTPLSGADDPKVWVATSYCMPREVRRKLLGFSEDQANRDLAHCLRRVDEERTRAATPPHH